MVALCCGNNGVKGGKGDGQRMFDDFLVVSAKQIQKITRSNANLKLQKCVHAKQVVDLCYGNIGVKGVRGLVVFWL